MQDYFVFARGNVFKNAPTVLISTYPCDRAFLSAPKSNRIASHGLTCVSKMNLDVRVMQLDGGFVCLPTSPRARGKDQNSNECDLLHCVLLHQNNILRRFGLFDQGFLADDDHDAGIADVEAAAVSFKVIADLGALGQADVAVDDGAADARVAADIHVVVDDGIRDFAVTVDADVVANHGFLNASAGDDRAAGHNGIEGDAHALRIGKDKFCRRILVLPGAQRPGSVVEVENGRHADEIHVGFVVGVERADIAPVESVLGAFTVKIVSKDAAL